MYKRKDSWSFAYEYFVTDNQFRDEDVELLQLQPNRIRRNTAKVKTNIFYYKFAPFKEDSCLNFTQEK
jgi:ABC-type antimicrobial peptide transport system ATPase subunit